MKHHNPDDLFDQIEDLDFTPRIKNAPPARSHKTLKPRPAQIAQPPGLQDLLEKDEDRSDFNYTYKASRYESVWLSGSLSAFFEAHWFDDVLRLVKGGKEASVYLCQANPVTNTDYLAAKVYRPRKFRNLKNDHLYREGRNNLDANGQLIHDSRMNHAMTKKTEYGMELMHTSWIEHEYLTLQILSEAGADTPIPYTRGNNAILMGYVGEVDVSAPTLNDVELSPREARPLYQRVMHNIELMLLHNRIHGDLSAFNILYWDGDITLIDFPQAMQPDQSPNTFRIFERDVLRVCEYFARQGVHSDPRKIAADLWTAQRHRMFPEVDPHYLDDENEADVMFWKMQVEAE
jgi:RIO kinase 1